MEPRGGRRAEQRRADRRDRRAAAARGEDKGTGAFLAAWTDVTDQLDRQAGAALAARHRRTAGQDHLPYVSTYIADWVSDVFR
jgi:hypothetical protein